MLAFGETLVEEMAGYADDVFHEGVKGGGASCILPRLLGVAYCGVSRA